MTAKPKKPKRTQEQRRRDAKERILAATLDILAREGHTRFTTTRVAAKAGVSRGAQENYYPTKTDLLAAATAHAMKQATEETAASAGSVNSHKDPVQAFLKDAGRFFLSRTYVAMEELALAGRDDRAISKIHRAAFVKFRKVHDAIWVDALTQAGYSRSEAKSFVELTIYLLRGMALTALILPERRAAGDLLRRWQAAAPAILGPRKK
jgi:AcrR family transcriptional regulator